MKRNSLFLVATLAVLSFSAPTPALAQTGLSQQQIEQLVADNARMRGEATRLREQANGTKDPAQAQALLDRADALDAAAHKALADAAAIEQANNEAAASSLLNEMDRATAEMDAETARKAAEARAERDREMYDQPGFWDKLGDKATDAIFSMISKLIEQWIAGGGQDDELLNQINDLQDERDRLINERENPTDGSGVGRIITDPNGNYGYDRDGDGFVDIPLNPDGTPAGPFNPSNPDAYNSANGVDGLGGKDGKGTDGLAGLAGLPGLGSGGGGASPGSAFNGGGFGGGSGGIGGATGGEGMNGGDEVNGFPGASAEDKDGDGKPDSEDDDGSSSNKKKDGEDDEREIETVMGRVLILPKAETEEEIAGDREDEGGSWSNDFEEWGDDDWDDSSDNGDKELSDSDFEGGKVGDAKEAAKLVEEVAQVETVIQEWRKAETEGEDSGESDPYGFQDDEMAGYRASGEDKKDPFKDVRDVDGNIDITKVNIWVIHRDSWKEGETPIRYKVKAPLDLKDFTPIHGGVLVARGIIEDLEVKDSVMDTIKGKVKKVELVSVILSAEKPPEDMDSLDPSKTKDSDVGGLDEEELEGVDGADEDW